MAQAHHKHGLISEPNGQGLCLFQCLPIAKKPHHSVTAIPTLSAAVHHSAYLIFTDKAAGGSAIQAVIEVPTAVAVGVPAAAHGKYTAGVSRFVQAISAKVGLTHMEYPYDSATCGVLHFHGEVPLLAKRNAVGCNPNGGKDIWAAHCGDHRAARRDFQGTVEAVGGVIKENLQCWTKKKRKPSITRIAPK